jgi:TonB family protein
MSNRKRCVLAMIGAVGLYSWPGSLAAHEPVCGIDAGELCELWSPRFAGGTVMTERPDRQGTVTVDLTISPDGHVSDCAISRASGNPDLDADTCAQLAAYAHYRPALDDAGEPTVGADRLTLDWVFRPPVGSLPDKPEEPEPKAEPLPQGLLAT